MKELRKRDFANGTVYCLELPDGKLIETTDTFLPFYTKDCINGNNALQDSNLGSRAERWMCGISTMSGCPVGCKFCATGQMKGWRNLTADEIIAQVLFVLKRNRPEFYPRGSQEFKINYTRMGEPLMNIDAVKEAIERLSFVFPNTHHYVSTVGIRGSDFSWVKDNITLQISLHSLDEDRRHELIPINNLMSIEELGQIRTKSNLKTTVNLTLVDEADFDIEKLKKYFDPEFFFIKLSPINKNVISEANNMGDGIIQARNLV
jgi:adenine C2-methylase RlmN of 23S rRNA A2503 and tRNA A37